MELTELEEYIKNIVESQAKEQFKKFFPEIFNDENAENYYDLFLIGYQYGLNKSLSVLSEVDHDSISYLEKMYELKNYKGEYLK